MREDKSIFKILIYKTTGRRPEGRPRHKWEVNIRIDLKEIDVNMRDWIDMTQDRDYWRTARGIEHPGSIRYGV